MVNFFGARTFFRSCECWNVTFLGGSDEPRPNILGTCSSRPAPTPHGRKKIFPRATTSGGHPQRPPKPLFSRFLADAAPDPAQTFGPGVIPPGAPPCATRSSVPPLLDPKRPPISPTRPRRQIPTPPPCSPAQITPLPKKPPPSLVYHPPFAPKASLHSPKFTFFSPSHQNQKQQNQREKSPFSQILPKPSPGGFPTLLNPFPVLVSPSLSSALSHAAPHLHSLPTTNSVSYTHLTLPTIYSV